MITNTHPVPGWAEYLQRLFRDIARHPESSAARESRREAWQLVYFTLGRYLRYHSVRMVSLEPDDVEDIASEKTLELMQKVDSASGRLLELEASEMPAFLSTVARNGLLTWLKRYGRTVSLPDEEEPVDRERPTSVPGSPAGGAESSEYASALALCAQSLQPRSLRVWYLRVFHEMTSRDIADYPGIRLKPSHVDVVLHRARNAVRQCMESRGHDPRAMPPGTFVALWCVFHALDEERERVI